MTAALALVGVELAILVLAFFTARDERRRERQRDHWISAMAAHAHTAHARLARGEAGR